MGPKKRLLLLRSEQDSKGVVVRGDVGWLSQTGIVVFEEEHGIANAFEIVEDELVRQTSVHFQDKARVKLDVGVISFHLLTRRQALPGPSLGNGRTSA